MPYRLLDRHHHKQMTNQYLYLPTHHMFIYTPRKEDVYLTAGINIFNSYIFNWLSYCFVHLAQSLMSFWKIWLARPITTMPLEYVQFQDMDCWSKLMEPLLKQTKKFTLNPNNRCWGFKKFCIVVSVELCVMLHISGWKKYCKKS